MPEAAIGKSAAHRDMAFALGMHRLAVAWGEVLLKQGSPYGMLPGLTAVAEVSVLPRLLGQEPSAGRAVCQGCRHYFSCVQQ